MAVMLHVIFILVDNHENKKMILYFLIKFWGAAINLHVLDEIRIFAIISMRENIIEICV